MREHKKQRDKGWEVNPEKQYKELEMMWRTERGRVTEDIIDSK